MLMKILITILENLCGRVDEALPCIIGIAVGELAKENITESYTSMIMQVLSMCFWYNGPLTFHILE